MFIIFNFWKIFVTKNVHENVHFTNEILLRDTVKLLFSSNNYNMRMWVMASPLLFMCVLCSERNECALCPQFLMCSAKRIFCY